jgi:hypothetical protein
MKIIQIKNLIALILPNATVTEDCCDAHGFFEVNYNGQFCVIYLNPNGDIHFKLSKTKFEYGEFPPKVSFSELEDALKELSKNDARTN